MSIKGKLHHIFSAEEQAKIDWAPIEKPKEIPAFLTQRVPKIEKDTQMQWSPDSKSLYLVDETGLWRCDIGNPFVYQWTQIVKSPSIARFQISPIGTHVLYEVALKGREERAIWILSIEPGTTTPLVVEPRRIAKGWEATFNPEGKTIFYSSLEAFTEIYLDGKEHRAWDFATYTPDPNKQVKRFTIHGNCICAVDGSPLDNGIVTYGGKDYQNVTVVKWNAGRKLKGEAKTSASGMYTFKDAPHGYNLKLTVTSTHYHQHGTGQNATVKKCTYSYTEPLKAKEVEAYFWDREVEGKATEILEKNLSVTPDTVEKLP